MISFKNIRQIEEIAEKTGYRLTTILSQISKFEDENGNFVFSGNKYGVCDFWGNVKKIGIYKISYSSENGNIIIKSVEVELDEI